jgi:ribosome-associated protein
VSVGCSRDGGCASHRWPARGKRGGMGTPNLFPLLGRDEMVQINQTQASPSKTVPTTSSTPRRRRTSHQVQDDVPFHAAARTHPDRVARARENAVACARIADDNRAKDILVLDLREATPLVDFFVIATAGSRRQSHAIASEIDQEMKRRGERKLGIEGSEEGRWILIDYGDFVVHIFSGESRTYYALEEVWGDAARVDWQDPNKVRAGSRDASSADNDDAGDDGADF